jgi:hypothetical protein
VLGALKGLGISSLHHRFNCNIFIVEFFAKGVPGSGKKDHTSILEVNDKARKSISEVPKRIE